MRRPTASEIVLAGAFIFLVMLYVYLASRPFDLQAAMDAAAPGDIIVIPAGTHAGPFAIANKRGITLQGPADAVLTAKGSDILSISDCADVVLEGFTLAGDYSKREQKGVAVSGLQGGAFRGLTIRDAGFAGIYSNGAFTNVTISGCSIAHCGDFGIHFQNGGNQVLVIGCVLFDFASELYAGHGIYAKTSANVTIKNCEVSGVKHLRGNGDGGIQLTECTNAQVIDCTSYGNDRYGFIVDGGVAGFIRCYGGSNGAADFYEYACPGPSTYTDCVGSVERGPTA